MKKPFKRFLNKLLRYFFQGILFIAPGGITIYIFYIVFTYIDKILRSHITDYMPFNIPGLGLILLILIILIFGFIGQTIVFKPLNFLLDHTMKNLPLVKVLYSALKDLFSAFVGTEKKFNKPVLVKVNLISDLEKIGFLTSEDLSELNINDKVAVYFPHSYNFSGELFLVPREHITPLSISSAEAMKFIVSGGITKV